MTIAVLLTGRKCSLAASDTVRVERDGLARWDYREKVFELRPGVIGAYAGLLEIGGQATHNWIKTAFTDDVRTLDALADRVAGVLAEQLRSDASVDFGKRTLEVLLGATSTLSPAGAFKAKSIWLRPNPETKTIECRVEARGWWCAAGDPSAQAEVGRQLRRPGAGALRSAGLIALRTYAERLIRNGIDASGQHPDFPTLKACGGEPVYIQTPR